MYLLHLNQSEGLTAKGSSFKLCLVNPNTIFTRLTHAFEVGKLSKLTWVFFIFILYHNNTPKANHVNVLLHIWKSPLFLIVSR